MSNQNLTGERVGNKPGALASQRPGRLAVVQRDGGVYLLACGPAVDRVGRWRPPDAGRALAVPEAPAAPPARGCETVLVVEDDAKVRGLTREILAQQGYQVLEAGTGDEALWVASHHQGPIHLLVTDVVLPRTDSRDLVGHLTELRPGLKVLYFSGYPDEVLSRYGISAAEVPFLSKPFLPAALTQKAREALDR
jgi:CheY-like chemotaxis protein